MNASIMVCQASWQKKVLIVSELVGYCSLVCLDAFYLLSTYKCDIQETADCSTEQEMFPVTVQEIFTAPQLSAARILLACRIEFFFLKLNVLPWKYQHYLSFYYDIQLVIKHNNFKCILKCVLYCLLNKTI